MPQGPAEVADDRPNGKASNAGFAQSSWTLKRTRWHSSAWGLLACTGFGVMCGILSQHDERPPTVWLFPLTTMVFGIIGVTTELAVPVHRVSVNGHELVYQRGLGKPFRISRTDIRGVVTRPDRMHTKSIRLGLRSRICPLGLPIYLLGPSPDAIRSGLAAILGECEAVSQLEPGSAPMLRAQQHFEIQGGFAWSRRWTRVMPIVGTLCLLLRISIVASWSWWLPMFIGMSRQTDRWIGVYALCAMYPAGAAVALAVLTVLDAFRGGAVVGLSADRAGFTLRRRWRTRRLPAESIRIEPFVSNRKGALGAQVWRGRRRFMRLYESQWTPGKDQIVPALLLLFDPKHYQDPQANAAQPAGAPTSS